MGCLSRVAGALLALVLLAVPATAHHSDRHTERDWQRLHDLVTVAKTDVDTQWAKMSTTVGDAEQAVAIQEMEALVGTAFDAVSDIHPAVCYDVYRAASLLWADSWIRSIRVSRTPTVQLGGYTEFAASFMIADWLDDLLPYIADEVKCP